MKIIGPDEVVFGVDDMNACGTYLSDYGLIKVAASSDTSERYEALDGTSVAIFPKDDPALAPALPSASMLRKTTYGVVDQETIDAIKAELSTDRDVTVLADGSLEAYDDAGFLLGFQVTVRRKLSLEPELVNSPGAPMQRPVNQIGADEDVPALPQSLSHIVYFVPDSTVCEKFYVERLGFVVTDRFKGAGPFLRGQASIDHHCLFMIQTPEYMKGIEHFAFHMQGPTELMLAGARMVKKGYSSFWGPGRHKLGSNWFWYFNSPLGTHLEYDADMDLHDDNWVPRTEEMNPESSQMFMFENRKKWTPGPGD
ncbi:MAG: glyoxalase [Rhodobacteraceae bacterium]|nr:MAG: glyoxalase [Paracoccaceae bacterium]